MELAPNQFDPTLTPAEQFAACGPAAAVGMARFLGMSPSLREVVDLARTVGWTESDGMAGPVSEVLLLSKLGIGARLEWTTDWGRVESVLAAGAPVIVDCPQHYYLVDEYDPDTDCYHVGYSGLAYRGGAAWMKSTEMEGKAGPMRATIRLA